MAEYIEREAVLKEINDKMANIGFTSPYQDHLIIMLEGMERIRDSVEDAPAADVAPVVRCKDCKHWEKKGFQGGDDVNHLEYGGHCPYSYGARFESDFCSYGRTEGR